VARWGRMSIGVSLQCSALLRAASGRAQGGSILRVRGLRRGRERRSGQRGTMAGLVHSSFGRMLFASRGLSARHREDGHAREESDRAQPEWQPGNLATWKPGNLNRGPDASEGSRAAGTRGAPPSGVPWPAGAPGAGSEPWERPWARRRRIRNEGRDSLARGCGRNWLSDKRSQRHVPTIQSS
jgi:hypothetical protein